MTENFNDDEEMKYQLDNLSAKDSEEAHRENEMFRAMQDEASRDNNRETLIIQQEQFLNVRSQGVPTKMNSPAAAAAVAAITSDRFLAGSSMAPAATQSFNRKTSPRTSGGMNNHMQTMNAKLAPFDSSISGLSKKG